ncbi:hypothetical protein CKO12_06345 [Chromatium okenii]|uniref:PilZ domain-containing protein n=1 Tax=Chromatium okenii TaxID=61644 RepID=UPI001906153B|nr:PilZ domain-containing protein [Chromatium okenii]MBK1641501.1 hypothetical protein [Chromatium okenii]
MPKKPFDERRHAARKLWEGQVQLLPLIPKIPVLGIEQVLGQDLSEKGLQVQSKRALPLQTTVLIEMHIPDCQQGIQVMGAVSWISPATNNQWNLGIEFSDVGDSARHSIRALLEMDELHCAESQTVVANCR